MPSTNRPEAAHGSLPPRLPRRGAGLVALWEACWRRLSGSGRAERGSPPRPAPRCRRASLAALTAQLCSWRGEGHGPPRR